MKKNDVMSSTNPWAVEGVEEQPRLVERREGRTCYHKNAYVDRSKRQVICSSKECGAVLDPFDFVVELARDGTDLVRTREELRRARTELHQLDQERAKLKSSVAGLKKRRGM